MYAKWNKFSQSFCRVSIRNTFHELMNGSNRICSNVRAGIIKDHIENEIKEGIGQMDADLTAGICDGIY
jgi:hypothetical protein